LQLIARLLKALQWPPVLMAVLLLALLVLAVVGLTQLRADDDIALLQASPPALKQEEQRAMAIVGSGISQQFLLIEGDSPAQVQQREWALLVLLNRLVEQGQLQRFDAISRLLPPVAQQQRDRALLQQTLTEPLLLQYGQDLGLASEPLLRWRKALLAQPAHYLGLPEWLASEAAKPWQHLWLGQTERGYASVVTLYGANEQARVQLQQAGLTVVDKRGDISALLTDYRQRAVWLVAISYGFIFVLLALRYGLGRAVVLLLPPALAVLLVLATLGLSAQPMNLFHLLALLLVLGVGVDYTLFLQEGREHRQQTALAILLSALTTLLSFGLLALSNTPAVQAFGLTVLIGVATCLLLAPMLVVGSDNNDNKNDKKATRPL
jgi:predicted exporter